MLLYVTNTLLKDFLFLQRISTSELLICKLNRVSVLWFKLINIFLNKCNNKSFLSVTGMNGFSWAFAFSFVYENISLMANLLILEV